MSRDWILREQGSRDWRMLPIAIVMWAASLGAHALFAWRMSDGLGTGQAKADAGAGIDVTIIGMEWPVTRILPITVASCAAVAAMIVVSFRLRIRWTGTLTVCVAVACIGSMTAIASDTIAWHDPASAQARQSSSYHEVMAHSPSRSSWMVYTPGFCRWSHPWRRHGIPVQSRCPPPCTV